MVISPPEFWKLKLRFSFSQFVDGPFSSHRLAKTGSVLWVSDYHHGSNVWI